MEEISVQGLKNVLVFIKGTFPKEFAYEIQEAESTGKFDARLQLTIPHTNIVELPHGVFFIRDYVNAFITETYRQVVLKNL